MKISKDDQFVKIDVKGYPLRFAGGSRSAYHCRIVVIRSGANRWV
ncbi:hypothetical protein QF028_006093 [Neobacillus sp. B4I6]